MRAKGGSCREFNSLLAPQQRAGLLRLQRGLRGGEEEAVGLRLLALVLVLVLVLLLALGLGRRAPPPNARQVWAR